MDTAARRILCVEDDEASRVVLAGALKAFSASFANTGGDAVRRLHSHVFDAYVLDLWLPDYNGVPLCREIRRHDPHVPIVIWTVADKGELEGRARRAGADAYLHKGPDFDILVDTLHRLNAGSDERASAAYSTAHRTLTALTARYRASAAYAAQSHEEARASVERVARSRTLDAFLSVGGTRSQFERWWAPALESCLS